MTSRAVDQVIYQFGPFRLDPTDCLLLRDGQSVPLTPKAFDLLVYLVEHHGQLVEKQTLMEALWPNTVVEDVNLAYNVSALRKALDEGRDGTSMIQTVPTRGYRFVAPVSSSSPPAAPTSAVGGPENGGEPAGLLARTRVSRLRDRVRWDQLRRGSGVFRVHASIQPEFLQLRRLRGRRSRA